MTKEEIFSARKLNLHDLINLGFSMEELLELGEVTRQYYFPSSSKEFFDGCNFYNLQGEILRDPEEYNVYSEGYTPFGDE